MAGARKPRGLSGRVRLVASPIQFQFGVPSLLRSVMVTPAEFINCRATFSSMHVS